MYMSKAGSSEKIPIFNANKAQIHTKITAAEADQEEFESRKLWSRVTKGLTTKNLDYATAEKTAIEDNQRTVVKDRAEKGIAWERRFFHIDHDHWKLRLPK